MSSFDAEIYSWEFYKNYCGQRMLRGIIKGDKKGRWADGHRVFTSVVESRKGDIVKTMNSTYKLCGPWEGSWRHRTLEDKIKEESGPVHYRTERW